MMPKVNAPRRSFRYSGPAIAPRAGGLASGVPTGTPVELDADGINAWLRSPGARLVPVRLADVPVDILLPVRHISLVQEEGDA